jgi:hypothetical protein
VHQNGLQDLRRLDFGQNLVGFEATQDFSVELLNSY